MLPDPTTALPEPETLRVDGSPCLYNGPERAAVTRILTLATSIAMASGLVLFGWDTIRVSALCIMAALLANWAVRTVAGRSEKGSPSRAVLIGMLTACTLPPTVSWPVPLVAAGLAALVAEALAGGSGRCLWHPVGLGRVAVQMLFSEQLSPARWPVLAPGHLLWGDLAASRALPLPAAWGALPLTYGVQAWEVLRPADVLAGVAPARAEAAPAAAIGALIRDALPPWSHTLTGVAGGAIGEACVLAAILGGLLLMWRGPARWQVPVAGVFTAALSAAVLPVAIQPKDGGLTWHWLPGADVQDGLPVGLVYVAYHLTAGGLPLVLLLLAADPASSPLTHRGCVLFGAVTGGLTVGLRVLTGLPAADYWALLIANTLVPLMNRAAR